MPDQDGLDACKAAYTAAIGSMNQVMISSLSVATTPEEKQEAIDRFNAGVALCKEARQICEQAFS